MISIEKFKILTPLQKLPKNVGDLDKLIVAQGFKKLQKVRKIAKSGHTESDPSHTASVLGVRLVLAEDKQQLVCTKLISIRTTCHKQILA